MAEPLPPNIFLDGSAVRRIREEKKLTQLYVAKVVGVTTDTISRWENNRYPSIKRDNALRLAEALEVDLEDLLQQDEEEQAEKAAEEGWPGEAGRGKKVSRLLPVFALLVLAAVLYLVYHRQVVPEPGLPAHRLLPNYAAPGGVVPVRVRLETDDETNGFILREHFPVGWKLIEANPPASSLNNEEGTARWIIKPGDERRRVVYLVRVAGNAPMDGSGIFSGEIIANPSGGNAPTPVQGDSRVKLGPFLWADQNGDQRVDDSEMLSASDTFDEMQGVHLDWDQLEDIWDAEGYRWIPAKKTFVPEHPSK